MLDSNEVIKVLTILPDPYYQTARLAKDCIEQLQSEATFYKNLLKKYITEVSTNEGVSFIPHGIGEQPHRTWAITIEPYTRKEIEALWKCEGYDYSNEVY